MFHHRKAFATTLVLLLFCLSILVNVQLVKAVGPIYIRSDGSIVPSDTSIQKNGNTYTFTNNIYDPIVVEKDDIIIDGAGYTLQGSMSTLGINLSSRTDITVRNMLITNFDYGIYLESSGHITISGTTLTNNNNGLWLSNSSNNTILGNGMDTNVFEDIYVYSSSNNQIKANQIKSSTFDGIYLFSSTNNTISENRIEGNAYGISPYYSSNNRIFHNSFINNQISINPNEPTDIWDDGYPSGGNYWSNHTGVDYFSGPYQNITGSDGIGDTPYIIDANNRDRFPLMNPWPPVMSIGGVVGITGYKLVFKETMNNLLGSLATIDYHWSFSVDKWDGTQWVATAISGSSAPVVGYVIPGLTTVDLPYYVYLPSPSTVKWGDWLRTSYTFHWTYSSTNYSTDYAGKLHVHPGDIAGLAVALPYFGADQRIGIDDANPVAYNWGKLVSWTGTFDPTDTLHIASITMGSRIGIDDVNPIAYYWGKTWTNAPPPG